LFPDSLQQFFAAGPKIRRPEKVGTFFILQVELLDEVDVPACTRVPPLSPAPLVGDLVDAVEVVDVVVVVVVIVVVVVVDDADDVDDGGDADDGEG